jgi:serine/threonine protein kinase
MSHMVGQYLGNYQLLRLLGRGGFALVYLGKHRHLGTHTAIKILNTRLEEDQVAKFQQKARILAQLNHPHIVRVFDPSLTWGSGQKGNVLIN